MMAVLKVAITRSNRCINVLINITHKPRSGVTAVVPSAGVAIYTVHIISHACMNS